MVQFWSLWSHGWVWEIEKYYLHSGISRVLTGVVYSSVPTDSLTLSELEFLKRLWGLGTEEEEGHRTGPPGYIGWRNSILGIDSGAPYTFKSTSSDKEQGAPF
jgi:hypothetical protein